jgi:hypothetical protein
MSFKTWIISSNEGLIDFDSSIKAAASSSNVRLAISLIEGLIIRGILWEHEFSERQNYHKL